MTGDHTGRVLTEYTGLVQLGRLMFRLAPGGTAEIVDIEVHNEYRRKGVGRLLVNRLCTTLPPESTVYAFTREENGIARDFYRALGFTEVSPLPDFYADKDRPNAALYYCKAGETK